MPNVKRKEPECFRIIQNPLMAAAQKFSPVRATWQYACIFTYLMKR